MRNVRAAAMFASGVTVLATALTGVVTPADAATPKYRLYVSTHANRSHPILLSGHTFKGKVYVFVKPASGANKVYFYLDDVKRKRKAHHTEGNAPYDLEGGVSGSAKANAKPLVTSNLRNGRHSVTIRVDLPNHKHLYSTAYFTVRNIPPKPTKVRALRGQEKVTISWKSGGGITAGFAIYRSTHSRVPLTHPIKVLSKKSHSYFDRNVKVGARYYYVVQARSVGRGTSVTKAVRSGTVLVAPLSVQITSDTAGGNGQVDLHWDLTGLHNAVKIYRGTGTGALTLLNTGSLMLVDHFVDSGLSNGTTYRYRVDVLNVTSVATKTVSSNVISVVPVGKPTNVAAEGRNGGAIVSWDSAGVGVSGYDVYRLASATGALGTPVGSTNASTRTWSDSGLSNGSNYYYAVRALSLNGHADSDAPATLAVPVAAPSAVDTEAHDGRVTVTWTADGPGVTGYEVYQSTSSSAADIVAPANHNRIASVQSGTAIWNDTGVVNGTPYYYIVRAISASGHADSSVTAATPVNAPSITSTTVDNLGNVTLIWTPSDAAVTDYKIYRSTTSTVATSASGSGAIASVADPTHTWTDTTTVTGQIYYYVVQAWYLGGHAESVKVHVTPDPPAAVQNLTPTPSANAVTLTWDSVDPAATELAIYRSPTEGQLGVELTPYSAALTMFVNSGLNSGDTWYYTVRTISPGGFTDSAQVPATVGP